jgi:hypothetical protein
VGWAGDGELRIDDRPLGDDAPARDPDLHVALGQLVPDPLGILEPAVLPGLTKQFVPDGLRCAQGPQGPDEEALLVGAVFCKARNVVKSQKRPLSVAETRYRCLIRHSCSFT